MIQRGDVLGVQRAPGNKRHDRLAAILGGDTIHIAIAISQTHCMEMSFAGMRTVRISRYKHIRVLRPPERLQPAVGMAINVAWHKHRWNRYNWLQCVAQGVYRWTGFWLPFWKKWVDNCSEVGASYAEILGEQSIGNENRYDPCRIVDHLIMCGWPEKSRVSVANNI